MRTFEIPVSYTIDTTFKVEAATLEQAIYTAQRHFATAPKSELIKEIENYPESLNKQSLKIDRSLAEELNPKKTYSVKLIRTQEVTVEVEADTEDDAQDAAIALHEDGKVPEADWEETDLETDDVEEEIC
jgi:hypothetical protein